MTDFEQLWQQILADATEHALAQGTRATAALADLDLEVDYELIIFTDDDAPWLPSVWLTPVGKDQFLAQQAAGDHRRLLHLAFGEDAQVYLNDAKKPVPGLFELTQTPAEAREQLTGLIARWLEPLWERHFALPAQVVHDPYC